MVDDSATIQKVFELAFENEDIEVLLTGNGSEALDLVRSERPAMVISDVNMPGLDGFDLCKALKESADTARVPVYLMSSALDDFDEERSAQVGAAGRFEKPFRSEDMVTQVRNAIATLGAEQEAPEKEQGDEEDSFEEIDVSLDSMMEAVEIAEDLDLGLATENIEDAPEEEPVAAPEEFAEPLLAEGPVSSVEPIDSPPPFEPEEVLARETDEPDAPDDFEAMEIDEPEAAETDDEPPAIEVIELSPSLKMDEDEEAGEDEDELEVEIVAGAEAETTEQDAEGPQTVDEAVAEAGEPDYFEESDISDQGRRALRGIEEDIEKELAATGDEFAAAAEDGREMGAERAFDGAIEEALDGGQLRAMLLETMDRVVAERLTGEVIQEAVSRGIDEAISELRPKMLEEFRKIARETTLNVAEGLVKNTIDQIKSGE